MVNVMIMIGTQILLESKSRFQSNIMRWFPDYKYVVPIPQEGIN
jgi:hypothetical protein